MGWWVRGSPVGPALNRYMRLPRQELQVQLRRRAAGECSGNTTGGRPLWCPLNPRLVAVPGRPLTVEKTGGPSIPSVFQHYYVPVRHRRETRDATLRRCPSECARSAHSL